MFEIGIEKDNNNIIPIRSPFSSIKGIWDNDISPELVNFTSNLSDAQRKKFQILKNSNWF